ncbi:MAG: hypothetical protein ACK4WH_04620 [Phycisphaerales bacterium]
MWIAEQIAELASLALAAQESEYRDEQAVYGLDALNEVELHPILAAGLSRGGLGVLREHPYPKEWRGKCTLSPEASQPPDRRDRLRCDLVLTPVPGQSVRDPLATHAALRQHRRDTTGTLFEAHAIRADDHVVCSASPGLPPEEAYWLEVKVIAQTCYTHGVPGPNSGYSGELRRAARDLVKLNDDPGIARGGLLVVLFGESEQVTHHDLAVLTHLCLDRDLPIGSPTFASRPIHDRIGNRIFTVGLLDLRKPAPMFLFEP